MNESTDQKVDVIFAELLAEVRKTSGPIDQSGEDFWKNHYKTKFKRAIDEDNRVYEADKGKLLAKAAQLAQEARARAGTGPITADHALRASQKVDCRRPRPDEPTTMEHWCY